MSGFDITSAWAKREARRLEAKQRPPKLVQMTITESDWRKQNKFYKKYLQALSLPDVVMWTWDDVRPAESDMMCIGGSHDRDWLRGRERCGEPLRVPCRQDTMVALMEPWNGPTPDDEIQTETYRAELFRIGSNERRWLLVLEGTTLVEAFDRLLDSYGS